VLESTTITLRFGPQMPARVKRLARSRYLNYQSTIKQRLSERLENEIQGGGGGGGTRQAPVSGDQ
jgi:hypothetical protein